ncbi:hypothetical protein SKAU_G00210510 [Synaphobranchus kaupii]|uniref:Uncharacterized protein n=1 Tax=Synaphobranchus kaupii TaxID=118154 RepID=A0A9Q1F8M4_SYNKA|nr:hypothetical protein SKAU_G00210510 [Synaphobranchus kaupii]
MPTLISPPDCSGCFRLSQKVVELQEPEPPIVSSILEEDPWARLGAKPKARICSTLAPSEPWIVIWGDKNRGRNSSCTPPPGSIQLGNWLDVLGKLEQHLSTVSLEPMASPVLLPRSSRGPSTGSGNDAPGLAASSPRG